MPRARPFRTSSLHELVTRLCQDLAPVVWQAGAPWRLERGALVHLDLAEVTARCMRYQGARRTDGHPYQLTPSRARRAARLALSVLRSHAIASGLLPA